MPRNRFAPYGQLFRSLVDPKSVLAGGEPGLNLLLIRLEDWCQETADRLPERATEFCAAISALATRTSRPLLVCFCPTAPDSRSLLEATTEVEGRIHDQLNRESNVFSHQQARRCLPVAFLFPGQGSQHWNMARELHETSSIFRSHFDQCCDELRNHLGLDLKQNSGTAV